ncbi:hypothetical protein SUDANB95_07929 (plasmid) [Actinosynnema sp. ALI-1.44]
MTTTSIQWAETDPGRVWRSLDGRYAIVANTLPETPPRAVYQARRIDEAMARAYPTRQDLGVLLDESPWCWNTENSVHSAQAVIERHAYTVEHFTRVPKDHPAVALSHFSHVEQGALAVVWKNGELVAQVLGMTLHDRDEGFVPAPWTEINLTELGLVPRDGIEVATTTDHGPEPCGNCSVRVGHPHAEGCSVAKCLVTGQQRLLCTYFGGSPTAGVEAVMTGSQDDFERYFKAPTGHDCGRDVWHGED